MTSHYSRPHLKTAATLGAALMLSGCADYVASMMAPPEAAKAMEVRESQFTHDVKFDNNSDRLKASERALIDQFTSSISFLPRDNVTVRVAKTDPMAVAERRASIVRAYLRLRQIPMASGSTETSSDPAAAPLRIVVSRYTVTLPKCPDWTKNPIANYANSVHSNFGCANAINLGQMVANPADLVRPTGPGLIDGDYATGAIERYRKGETIPLKGDVTSEVAGPATQDSGSSGGSQ